MTQHRCCAQIMEPCGEEDNKVFTKINPWVAAILALAAEIYNLDKLRLKVKFDIEMLFRLFSMQVEDCKPSDTLSIHVRDPIANQDFAETKAAVAPPTPDRQPAPPPEPPIAPHPAPAHQDPAGEYLCYVIDPC